MVLCCSQSPDQLVSPSRVREACASDCDFGTGGAGVASVLKRIVDGGDSLMMVDGLIRRAEGEQHEICGLPPLRGGGQGGR